MKTERFEMWVAAATALLIAACTIGISATFNQANAEDPASPKPANQNPLGTQSQFDNPNQGQIDAQQHTANYPSDEEKEGCRASKLIGMTVKSKADQEIGSIEDLMLGHDGQVKYAAVSFGGFLGMGDKLFAVPWDQIHIQKSGTDPDEAYAQIEVSEQTLRSKQGFDQNKWPKDADKSFEEVGARTSAQPQDVQR